MIQLIHQFPQYNSHPHSNTTPIKSQEEEHQQKEGDIDDDDDDGGEKRKEEKQQATRDMLGDFKTIQSIYRLCCANVGVKPRIKQSSTSTL